MYILLQKHIQGTKHIPVIPEDGFKKLFSSVTQYVLRSMSVEFINLFEFLGIIEWDGLSWTSGKFGTKWSCSCWQRWVCDDGWWSFTRSERWLDRDSWLSETVWPLAPVGNWREESLVYVTIFSRLFTSSGDVEVKNIDVGEWGIQT